MPEAVASLEILVLLQFGASQSFGLSQKSWLQSRMAKLLALVGLPLASRELLKECSAWRCCTLRLELARQSGLELVWWGPEEL